jgi:salicylate hydroxylase
MAVEDGAVLGKLLGLLTNSISQSSVSSYIPLLLKLYESLRKLRTTVNVKGAVANQHWYHLPDGAAQEARDRSMIDKGVSEWNMLSSDYQMEMLGFDAIADAENEFAAWWSKHKP